MRIWRDAAEGGVFLARQVQATRGRWVLHVIPAPSMTGTACGGPARQEHRRYAAGRDQCLLLGARHGSYARDPCAKGREVAAASLPHTTTAEIANRDHPDLSDVRDDVEVPAQRGWSRLSRA